MRELLERLRVPLLFLLLVAVSLVALASDRRALPNERGQDHGWLSGLLLDAAAPFQKAFAFPVELVRDGWTRYAALLDVRGENEELRARLAALEEENLQFREALIASQRLQRIAEMRDLASPMRPAQVVGEDVSPWFRSVLLDRGRTSDVRSGMPVVTDRGVVGLVTATSPYASRVMLLLDAQSSIDGIVQRSRARGIVRGAGTDQLEFVFYVRGDDVQVGDEVITSGFGGVYPKGLRIAEVMEVMADEDQLLHRARLRPAVDFGRLEQVFVMLVRGASLELLYEGDGDLPGDDRAAVAE